MTSGLADPDHAPPAPGPDPRALAAEKDDAGLSLSVCLPARDEAVTVGAIVAAVRRELVEEVALVDELVVVDDGSHDATAAVARAAGARVVREADILTEAGPGSGKGNVLWKSLDATTGDLVCWVDADLRNFRASYVTRLVAPLVADPGVALVKADYDRSLDGATSGGGRVTELMARPVLSWCFPKLADVRQPLAGEYAGRRTVLETLPFVQGWGVEIGLLIDVVERYGRDAVAEVDLGVREHRNRPLTELGPQALAILVTALRRAGLAASDDRVAELVAIATDGETRTVDVEVGERPPILTVASYRDRHPR